MPAGDTRLGTAALFALMLLLLVIFIGPIFWFVLLAIRPADTFFTMPPVLAFTPIWDSVNYAFGNPGNNLTNPLFGQSTQTLASSLGSGGANGGFNPLYQIGGPRSIQLAL